MKKFVMAAAAVFLLTTATTSAEARRHIVDSSDHIQMTNDGRFRYVEPDKTPRARAREPRQGRKVRLASLGTPDVKVGPSLSRPMGNDAIQPNRHGMVWVETAYGRKIEVNPIDASKFLKFFQLLHDAGYKIDFDKYVGCYSPGHKPGSNHRIGRACDIQTGWNRGPSFVYHMDKFVKAAGLYNGCSFGDCGHVEAVRGLHNPRPNLATALAKFHSEIAERQDEARAFSDHAAVILPEPTREKKVSAKDDKPKKKKVASRSQKRRYAHHHHRTRLAQG